MQRRQFIVGLGAAITGSIQTDAQELQSVPLVGYLDDGPAEGFIFRQVLFREGLAVVDYYEGCNVAIEAHWARLPDWASDLVDRGVAVLVASGSVSAILAAKAATTTIPIVFGFGADPVETGLVSSLDHPGGNITGVTSMIVDIGSKRLGLSKLFRRLMLTKLAAAHEAGQLRFFGAHAHLTDAKAFAAFLAPLRKTRWFVYAKRPFAGPKAVLAYLSRYTHRVAISNRRLIAFDERRVTFKVKDYRIDGPGRYTTMTLDVGEFIRRFLIHVLPKGFHRIRHYGLFATSNRAETIARARELLGLVTAAPDASTKAQQTVETDPPAQADTRSCPCCGSRMFIIETFEAGSQPRHRPAAPRVAISIDTS